MPNPKKPPTSVRSIRLPDDLWAMLEAQAASLDISLNRYVAMRLEGARRDVKKAQKVIDRANDDSKLVRALQDVAAGAAGVSRTVAVPVGPRAVAPGALLKKR